MRPLMATAMVGLTSLGALAVPAEASSINRELVAAPIREKYPAFLTCQDQALERDPEFRGGRVTTRFVIEKGGRVSKAQTTANETGDRVFAACVRDVFLTVKYADDWPQVTTILYPLTFE